MTTGGKQDAGTLVDLWQIELYRDGPSLGEAASLLSDDECDRLVRSPLAVRRHRILARAALRTVLGSYTRRHPRALQFAYNANGKPRLADIHGGCEVSFNLTTSDGCCLIAVTKGAEIGVDVEHLVPLPAINRIAAGVFSPAEAAVIARLTGEPKLTEFFTCWTRCEARVKARGLRLSHGSTLASWDLSDGWTHLTLHPGPGVIGALVVSTGGRGTQLDLREQRLTGGGWT